MSRTATRSKKEKATPPPPPRKEAPPRIGPHRDTVESLAVAFILALLIRGFEAEAFVIPTGSMAPTLMLRFHHWMKESEAFQRDCRKERWEFPPGSSWIVFTDTTSHSCISGQYALEQTFVVSRSSLAWPEKAPIAIMMASVIGPPSCSAWIWLISAPAISW